LKIKQFNSNTLEYIDTDIKQPGKYAYAIKLVMLDGKSGVLKESEFIEIPDSKD
jgi:hypothetical protein